MMGDELVTFVLQGALFINVLLMLPASYRIWKGPTVGDRLLAVDLTTTMLICTIVLVALITGTELFIDMGIALAAFSFVATFGAARYYSEGRMF